MESLSDNYNIILFHSDSINNEGQNDFGESRFQEAIEKQFLLKDFKNIKWHFIGRVQSNKIRKIVQNFDYIHSVDSTKSY